LPANCQKLQTSRAEQYKKDPPDRPRNAASEYLAKPNMNFLKSITLCSVLLGCALSLNSCNSPYRRVTQKEYPDYPLYHAVEKGNVAEAKRWVAWHRKNNQPIPDNLLFAAVNNTDKAMADLVLGLGLDWNKKLNDRRVIDLSNLYMKGKLYDSGYPVDSPGYNGASDFWNLSCASIHKVEREKIKVMELMLSKGANVNFLHEHQTPLDTWMISYDEMFKVLKPGVERVFFSDYHEWIRLHQLSRSTNWHSSKKEMITFLRKHGGKLASELPKAANKPE